MSALDFAIGVLLLASCALGIYYFRQRPRRGHRWAELDSTDVATAIRRVRRPRC